MKGSKRVRALALAAVLGWPVALGAAPAWQTAVPGGQQAPSTPISPAPTSSGAKESVEKGAAPAPLADVPSMQPMLRLVGDFVRAQQAFDVPALSALTTPDYLEISPVGELDTREKMLSFYAPDKKAPAPPVELRDPVVRVFGDTAIVVATLAYTMQPPGQPPRVMALRASFVAHRLADRWKLASAHYTGIRPAAK